MTENSRLKDPRILVVDDEPDLRTLYELTLLREGYRVDAAGSLDEARQFLAERLFDVVITDMRLPDGLGLELIQEIKSAQRSERCVVITAYGSAENAVESLKAGAFDYLTKPVDLKQFRTVIASAVLDSGPAGTGGLPDASSPSAARFSSSAVQRKSGPEAAASPAGEAALARLIGKSSVMCGVRERLAKVARSMAPVLIRGESGTGKELAASALHANSHRATGPLVAVNCSAIPENLLESEFFGVKKGAFTGATHDRAGFFQAASGGTLFLDEIGDLPLAMQSKLLRAIQERNVRPVGGVQEEPVNVRIISASHKNLADEVQNGRFRQDLYYRLNVIEILIPPLRERAGDLPELCEALLKRICAETGAAVPPLSSRMIDQLALQRFSGNVRELENMLHRAVALWDGDEFQFDLDEEKTMPVPLTENAASDSFPTPLYVSSTAPEGLPGDLQDHLDKHEREILVKTLQETGFNRTAAATRLGLSLRQIRYRISRLNIEVPLGNEASDESA